MTNVMTGDNVKEIVYLPIAELYQHPDNPRKDVGDVTELADSIRAKGVMQNLTVVRGHYENGLREAIDGGYTVIIGHRRRAAAIEAGLEVLPCAIVNMDYREQVSTMLLENMQRVDLTPYEQAQGFQMMMDLGETIDGIAEKTGFSKKTVKHRLEVAKLNANTLKAVSSERQITMADLEKLEQIKDVKIRNKVLEDIGTYNFNNQVERAVRKEAFLEWLPLVKAELKELGAKALSDNERYQNKYENLEWVSPNDKRDEGKPIIKKKYHKEKLFYYINDWNNSVCLYRQRPKAEAVKRPKAEIEREKDIKERERRLKALTDIAATLRANFVMSLEMTAKNREKMLRGAVAVLEANVVSYMYSIHSKSILEFIGETPTDDYNKIKTQFKEMLASKPSKMIPAIIYKSFENDGKQCYYNLPYDSYPCHAANVWLDGEYDWLISLGYEMSDDERQLRDGTHEVFKVEAEK